MFEKGKTRAQDKLLYLMVGLNIGALMIIGLTVMAENTELDTGARVIPYNGFLEFNGTAFTGQADVRFTLTDEDQCNFVEDHEDVQVFAGKFSVGLGTVAGDLPACLFDAQAVFLEMAVRGGNEDTPHVSLAGRQRINPVPFAYWAAEGSDFKVDGDTLVSGNASIGTSNVRPPTDQPRLELKHNVDLDGVDNFNDYQLVMWRGDTPANTFGQGIQNGTMFFNVPPNDQYIFNRGGTTPLFTLTNPTSTIHTALNVSGATSVTGALSSTGALTSPSATFSGRMTAGSAVVTGSVIAQTLTSNGALNAGNATLSGQLQSNTISTGNITSSGTMTVAGNANVTGDITGRNFSGGSFLGTGVVGGSLGIQLPHHTSPPVGCSAATVGRMYLDTNNPGGRPRSPCICIFRTDVSPNTFAWVDMILFQFVCT